MITSQVILECLLKKPPYEILEIILKDLETAKFKGMRRLFVANQIFESIHANWPQNLSKTWLKMISIFESIASKEIAQQQEVAQRSSLVEFKGVINQYLKVVLNSLGQKKLEKYELLIENISLNFES